MLISAKISIYISFIYITDYKMYNYSITENLVNDSGRLCFLSCTSLTINCFLTQSISQFVMQWTIKFITKTCKILFLFLLRISSINEIGPFDFWYFPLQTYNSKCFFSINDLLVRGISFVSIVISSWLDASISRTHSWRWRGWETKTSRISSCSFSVILWCFFPFSFSCHPLVVIMVF